MNEQLSKLFSDPRRNTAIIAALLGFGTGLGLGHILSSRKKGKLYAMPNEQLTLDMDVSKPFDHERMQKIVHREEAKRGMPLTNFEPIMPTPAFERTDEPIRPKPHKNHEEDVVITINPVKEQEENVRAQLFENDDEWDYKEELKNRSSSEPYVIHKDEFWSNEMDYAQITLTYYAGDDIMVDQEDSPVYSYELVTGPLMFGHGSGDPNVFHVRNDKRKAEYEIIHDDGLYSVEVLGLQIENNERVKKNLKHSTPRKFKKE